MPQVDLFQIQAHKAKTSASRIIVRAGAATIIMDWEEKGRDKGRACSRRAARMLSTTSRKTKRDSRISYRGQLVLGRRQIRGCSKSSSIWILSWVLSWEHN
jgi:hypothetical protein